MFSLLTAISAYIFSNSGQCCPFLVEYEPQVQGEIQPESAPSAQLESYTEASTSGEQYTNGEYYPHITGYSQNVPQDGEDGLHLGPESHGEELTGNGHVVQGEEAEFCEGQSQGQPQGQGHDGNLYQGHDDQFEGENHTEGDGRDPGQGDSDYIPESPHPAAVPEGAIQIPEQVTAEQENGRVALDITAYARAVATAAQAPHVGEEIMRGENIGEVPMGENIDEVPTVMEENGSHAFDSVEMEGVQNIVGNAAEVNEEVMQEFSETHEDVTTVEQGGVHHDTGMESGMESDQYDMAPENAPHDHHTADQHGLQIETVSSQHESEMAPQEFPEGTTQDIGNNYCH